MNKKPIPKHLSGPLPRYMNVSDDNGNVLVLTEDEVKEIVIKHIESKYKKVLTSYENDLKNNIESYINNKFKPFENDIREFITNRLNLLSEEIAERVITRNIVSEVNTKIK